MTKEQSDSLNSVRANWAYYNDTGTAAGLYATSDIHALITLLAEQGETLEFVREDLLDLKVYVLSDGETEQGTVSMIDSTLALIESEK